MFLLLADDLTGACDSGIAFAETGLKSIVALFPQALNKMPNNAGLIAVNTGTRNGSETGAREIVAGVCSRAREVEAPALAFKKIDSTMRGNPGVEIATAMSTLGIDLAFITPAAPDLGRTVVNGRLLINGIPIDQTDFARDPLSPVKESGILGLLGGDGLEALVGLEIIRKGPEAIGREVARLSGKGVTRFVFDAEENADLRAIVAAGLAFSPLPLFAGSSGLAFAIASLLPHKPPKVSQFESSQVLFVCGSAHSASHAQIGKLRLAGVPVFYLPSDTGSPGQREGLGRTIAASLGSGSAVLAAPLERLENRETAASVSMALADAALAALDALPVSTRISLCLTGGETACDVLSRMCDCVQLERQLEPGMVQASTLGGKWPGMAVVSKAGGFGAPGALLAVERFFSGAASLDEAFRK